MMKVIVADDEAKVCQLICSLVDWASLDMEVAGVAHNGIEALELVETLRPDLIITDIRMPGYDGLELISRAKAAKPDLAIPMYERFMDQCRAKGFIVEHGEFGADMQVSSVNDGPVTILFDL